jgi:hypothetical protein
MILEIILFISTTMAGIINAFDNVYLGSYSMLDLFLSIIYLRITFWGIFTLISYKKEGFDEQL